MTLHEDRGRAESFGAAAERYDRSRPNYPPELIDDVLGEKATGLRVLDVGCGTGIAARQMMERGASVLGVEVDERMAALARSRGFTVEVSALEAWEPAGRRFDRVTAAQAWHWVEPVRGTEVAAAALAPDGRVCLWWNVAQAPREFRALVEPLYARLAPEAHGYSVLLGSTTRPTPFGVEAAAAALGASSHFSAPERTTFSWSRRYTRDQWLDQLPTHSDHARLAPPVLADLLTAVGEAIDTLGGDFEMTYSTTLLSAWHRSR